MDYVEDLEQRIRERGVRVAERLELLLLLTSGPDGVEALSRRKRELAEAVRAAARRLVEEACR